MFPVCTGINRLRSCSNAQSCNVPCMHRDKPEKIFIKFDLLDMFPVCTGINRLGYKYVHKKSNVPCMHRDKPVISTLLLLLAECSLYAQG